MKIHEKRTFIILCLIFFSLSSTSCGKDSKPQEGEKPLVETHVDKLMHGFTIRIEASAEKYATTQQALSKMNADLALIVPFFTEEQLIILRKNPIWMEVSRDNGAAVFHPSRQWLVENGVNPDKAQCVEISNMTNYVSWSQQNQPLMILHELAHLYHHQAMDAGFDNPRIKTVFEAARASGKYNSVRYYSGSDTLENRKAYAMNDQMEYFAEISEAYFGNNDYYPFTHDDLETFDLEGFTLLEEIWGTRSASPISKTPTPKSR